MFVFFINCNRASDDELVTMFTEQQKTTIEINHGWLGS